MIDKWIDKARKILPLTDRQNVIAFGLDKRGRLISVGVNSFTATHPRQKYFADIAGSPHKQFLHAEIACLIRGKGLVKKLIVIRLNKKGIPRMAKPCEVCEVAIREARIKSVEYSI